MSNYFIKESIWVYGSEVSEDIVHSKEFSKFSDAATKAEELSDIEKFSGSQRGFSTYTVIKQ